MKDYILSVFVGLITFIVGLIIICLIPLKSYSFTCQIDGTCFARCMQIEDDIDYCETKCTKCGW